MLAYNYPEYELTVVSTRDLIKNQNFSSKHPIILLINTGQEAKSTVLKQYFYQINDFNAFQAPKPDPRETPPIRPLESDADVSMHNFYLWLLTVTRYQCRNLSSY